jgi:hypothetical protein
MNYIFINSILAVIYLTKLQNLINRPVMNYIFKLYIFFFIILFLFVSRIYHIHTN